MYEGVLEFNIEKIKSASTCTIVNILNHIGQSYAVQLSFGGDRQPIFHER